VYQGAPENTQNQMRRTCSRTGPLIKRLYHDEEIPGLTEVGNDPYKRVYMPESKYTDCHRKIGKLNPGEETGIVYPLFSDDGANEIVECPEGKFFSKKININEHFRNPMVNYSQLYSNNQ
jgi:hypothetical protein